VNDNHVADNNPLCVNIFGQTGPEVTIVGLGGEGILRTHGKEKGAQAVIEEAIAQGITYFDSARVYAGSESYYGLVWSKAPEVRARVFQASKSASRNRQRALADLERSISTLGVDYLDLWQIHDVRTREELDVIAGPGGALEAFQEAKEMGKTRYIGVTGHHDPDVLATAVLEWPVDSVMIPVNPVEGALGGFLDKTLPTAREKGIAIVGMKILGSSSYLSAERGITPEKLIRYALSQDITVAIVGCSTPAHVRTLASMGRNFQPMSLEEQDLLVGWFRAYATKLAYYRGVV
jgi:aryl-alcohol dehydrogenase-like predicted oxidoreductase